MIYFLIYLFLEVILTVEVASRIGGLATFLEIMGSALLGIAILFNFRTTLIANMMQLRDQKISANGFYQRNLLSLLGAILLILPGIFTDLLGLIIEIFLMGQLIINFFLPKYPKSYTPNQPKDDNVIDAEIINDIPSLR